MKKNIKSALVHFTKSKGLLSLIIIFYLINGLCYIRMQSLTSDEGSFLNYANKVFHRHPERTDPVSQNSKMPVVMLNLVPRIIEQIIHPQLHKNDDGASDILNGRYVTLFFSIFIILIVYEWTNKLYGILAALFAAFLTSICPNLLANAGFVTTDCYSALFLLLTMFSTWLFIHDPSLKRFCILSFFLATSQLAKQSLSFLYIIVPLCILIYILVHHKKLDWKKVAVYSFSFLCINWFIINAGFLFVDTNTQLKNFTFISKVFQNLQHLLPGNIYVPLPKAFITGLDMAKYFDQLGGGDWNKCGNGNVTVLGRSASFAGIWYYYIVSLFFKTPISIMFFIAGGIWISIRYRSAKHFFANEFILLLPVVFYVFYMSLFYKCQVGIRQLIFIYPLCYIFCGTIIPHINTFKRIAFLTCLSLYLLVSVLLYWSNYYPYTNEFIWDKKMAYSSVGASNLEFHQGKKFLSQYLLAHPDVKIPTSKPDIGTFIINTNDFLDVWNFHRFDWLSIYRPSGQVAYNWLLITVSQRDLEGLPNRQK
jgi:hypothetical protein